MQRGTIELNGTGAASGVAGPLMVGINGPNLTLAELEEAIENDPQSLDDPLNEQAGRFFAVLGFLHTGGDGINFRDFSRRFKQSYIEGIGMTFFVYNTDLSTAVSASTQVKIFCEHLGVWLRD